MKAKKCHWCDGTGKEPPGLFTKDENVGGPCPSCDGVGFDHKHVDDLTCPYCGWEDGDSWELGESDNKHQCGSCEKFFSYETQVTRTFSSSQAPCQNDDGDHDWIKPLDFDSYLWRRCRVCDKSERLPKLDSSTESK